MSSLYDSCLAVVAKNVCLVESFAGFPDIIGKQIFHAVEAASKFDLENPAESRCALSLFTTAYTDQVLSDVSMEGEHLSLANCMEHLMLFTHLRKINLASCCLGDAHELLYHISTLKSLQVLVLRNNSLTDEGIRRLTAPIRVMKTGPRNLQALDLSENDGVSVKCLKFLRVFWRLLLLDVSCTGIGFPHLQSQELKEYAKATSLTVKRAPPERLCSDLDALMAVETCGWAEGTIRHWIQSSRQHRHSAQQPLPSSSKSKRFYGRTVKNLQSKVPTHTPGSKKRTREPCKLSLVLVHSSLILRRKPVNSPASPVTTVPPTCQMSQTSSSQHHPGACPTKPQLATCPTKPHLATCPTKPQLPTCPTKPQLATCPTKPQLATCPTKVQLATCSTKPHLVTCSTKPLLATCPTKLQLATCPTKPHLVTCPTKPQLATRPTKPHLVTRPTKPHLATCPTKPLLATCPTKPQLATCPTKAQLATCPTKPQQATQAQMAVPQTSSWEHHPGTCPTKPPADNPRPNSCAVDKGGDGSHASSAKCQSGVWLTAGRVSGRGLAKPQSRVAVRTGGQAGADDAPRKMTKLADGVRGDSKRVLCDEDLMLLSQYGFSGS